MSYGELTLPPERPTHNPVNGQFLKGHVPYSKGKKWNEFMGKRAQKRCAKGWKNLRCKKRRSDAAGRPKKQVIAVMDDGTWHHFSCIAAAGRWIEGHQGNVHRCCRLNGAHQVNKEIGAINTDHKYKGVRFYLEEDDIWTTKIAQK